MALYFSESGTTGAPTILFVHGIGANGWMWKGQVAALSDFHCVVVDLPGHGQSNHSEWVSFADRAAQLAAMIQAHGADGRAAVVGLSLGGYLALELMIHHPDVVTRTIISGVTASPMPNRGWLPVQAAVLSALFNRRWFAQMQARAMGLSPAMEADLIAGMQATSMAAYRQIMREAVDHTAPPALQNVTIPTLVVAGEKEVDIIKQSVAALPALLPDARGGFAPNVGHGWNVEDPTLFTAMIRAWLTAAPLPPQLRMVA